MQNSKDHSLKVPASSRSALYENMNSLDLHNIHKHVEGTERLGQTNVTCCSFYAQLSKSKSLTGQVKTCCYVTGAAVQEMLDFLRAQLAA